MRDRDVLADLEDHHRGQQAREPSGRDERARHGDGHRCARARAGGSLDGVLDGGEHQRGPRVGWPVDERERAGQPIVQAVEPVERLRPGPLRQRPGPRHARARQHARGREHQHRPRERLARGTQLAQGHVDDGDHEGHTERLRTHTQRPREPDPPLRVPREPANALDALLVASHPGLGLVTRDERRSSLGARIALQV